MASKKASRKRRACTEYWIFDRGVLLCADGRPIILKHRKTAERFIAEMGMGKDWKVEEGAASVRETRGKKAQTDPAMTAAHLAWAMMKPKKRPTYYDHQRAFMERFRGPLTGDPKQKRKAVRAFIKQIRRLHERARSNPSIDQLLST
jgi:hypothetical protein